MIFHRMRGLEKHSTIGRTRDRRRLGVLEEMEGRVLLILIGGGGDTTLTDTGTGRNILIGGGPGGDTLVGGRNDIAAETRSCISASRWQDGTPAVWSPGWVSQVPH